MSSSDRVSALQAARLALQQKRGRTSGSSGSDASAAAVATIAEADPGDGPADAKRPRHDQYGASAPSGTYACHAQAHGHAHAHAQSHSADNRQWQSSRAGPSGAPFRPSSHSSPFSPPAAHYSTNTYASSVTSASPMSSPPPPPPYIPAAAAPSTYNTTLSIPSTHTGANIPQHWRTFETEHSLAQDLSAHFVSRGSAADRPANMIVDDEEDEGSRTGGDPQYRAYTRRCAQVVQAANAACPYMAKRIDLTPPERGGNTDLLQLLDVEGGGEFDVIVIDPPWQEYRDRAAAVGSAASSTGDLSAARVWSANDVARLPIPLLAAEPCLLFLWCGADRHVAEAHDIMKQWGFHKIDDIAWIQANKMHPTVASYSHGNAVFQRTFEHCLVGMRGREWVLRDSDHRSLPYNERMNLGLVQFVHPGVDIDCIVTEMDDYGSTTKPTDLYSLIERFCTGRRRLELFGCDHNLRNGWLTLGLGVSPECDNFDIKLYRSRFDHPVPPVPTNTGPNQQPHHHNNNRDAAHAASHPFDARIGGAYVPFDALSESLRPKSPPRANSAIRKFLPRRRRKGWNQYYEDPAPEALHPPTAPGAGSASSHHHPAPAAPYQAAISNASMTGTGRYDALAARQQQQSAPSQTVPAGAIAGAAAGGPYRARTSALGNAAPQRSLSPQPLAHHSAESDWQPPAYGW